MSSNPYYIQPQSSLGDIIDPMLKVASYQQAQTSLERQAEQLAEMKRINQIQHGVGTPGTPDFVPGTEQQKIDLQRQSLLQENNKLPVHRQNFGNIQAKGVVNGLSKIGVKQDNPFLQEVIELGRNPQVDNSGAFEYFQSAIPKYRQQVIDEVTDKYLGMVEKNPQYAETKEGQQQKAFIEALEADPDGKMILSGLFKGTIESQKTEEESSKAALLTARLAYSAPDRQYVSARKALYLKAGMDEENATVRAVEDLYTQEARKVKEGKFPPVNVSVSAPQQTQFVDANTGNPLIYDKRTGTYRVAKVEGAGGVAPRMVNPSAGEREKTAAFDTLSSQVQRIKATYNPNYVGITSGQVGRISQLWDPNEAAFRQVISDVKDSLLRARSGAQINEQEYSRLSKLVPDYTDSAKQFSGKMRSFEQTLNSLRSNRTAAQKRGGVYVRDSQPSSNDYRTKYNY